MTNTNVHVHDPFKEIEKQTEKKEIFKPNSKSLQQWTNVAYVVALNILITVYLQILCEWKGTVLKSWWCLR